MLLLIKLIFWPFRTFFIFNFFWWKTRYIYLLWIFRETYMGCHAYFWLGALCSYGSVFQLIHSYNALNILKGSGSLENGVWWYLSSQIIYYEYVIKSDMWKNLMPMKNMQIYWPNLHTCDQGNIMPHSLIIEGSPCSHFLPSFSLKKEIIFNPALAMHA